MVILAALGAGTVLFFTGIGVITSFKFIMKPRKPTVNAIIIEDKKE
jgi:hypothetical protein